jgi:hypothetical protein
LGLDICADILVGDAMHRGISGGQKKRVTTGANYVFLKYSFCFLHFLLWFGAERLLLLLLLWNMNLEMNNIRNGLLIRVFVL